MSPTLSLQSSYVSLRDALTLYAHLHYHSLFPQEKQNYLHSNLSIIFFAPSKYPGSYPSAPAIIPSSASTNVLSSFNLFSNSSLYATKKPPFLMHGAMLPPDAPAHVHYSAHTQGFLRITQEQHIDQISFHEYFNFQQFPSFFKKALSPYYEQDTQFSLSIQLQNAPMTPHWERYWRTTQDLFTSQKSAQRKKLLPLLQQLTDPTQPLLTHLPPTAWGALNATEFLEHANHSIYTVLGNALLSYHQQYGSEPTEYKQPRPLLSGVMMSHSGLPDTHKTSPYCTLLLPATHPLAALLVARSLSDRRRHVYTGLNLLITGQKLQQMHSFLHPYTPATLQEVLKTSPSALFSPTQQRYLQTWAQEYDSLCFQKDLQEQLPQKPARRTSTL